MQNIIKIVLLLSFGFGYIYATDEVYRLKKKLIKIENTKNKILIRKKASSKILTRYLIEVEKHLAFVTSFMAEKGHCLELESSYKSNKNEVLKCYEKLEISLNDFEDEQKEFFKLKKSIRVLKDMLATDKNRLFGLKQQKKALEGLIRMEISAFNGKELNSRDVEKLINEF